MNGIRKYFLVFVMLNLIQHLSIAQQGIPDSVITKYNAGKTQREKANAIYYYFMPLYANDSLAKSKAFALLSYFQKQNDEMGSDYVQIVFGNILLNTGDYSLLLDRALPLLSRFKERKDTSGQIACFYLIIQSYESSKNHDKAIEYWKKLLAIQVAKQNKKQIALINSYIGSNFASAFMSDSGLIYTQRGQAIASELKNDTILTYTLSTLAENYIVNKDYDLAMPFLRKSLTLALSTGLDIGNVGFIHNDFAQLFLGTHQYDSANYYARLGAKYCIQSGYKVQLVRAYEYLYKSFDQTGPSDSSSKYFRLATLYKDSLFSMEKTKAIEAINFREQIHQQELKTKEIKMEEERKQNIQFTLIALGIITLLVFFLLISHTFIIKPKLVRIFGIIGLLVTFEFLNLLLHPFIENITHHSPILMLLTMVCIAALLVPIHHWLEKWITTKLVEKNEKIRLATAKKIIEESEKNQIIE